ncbi:MAG: hypothetical protein KY397_01915 [Gemmatimonadetes bacterium]|nr:hypothetical protein [Gemmatimonadota bacterium]
MTGAAAGTPAGRRARFVALLAIPLLAFPLVLTACGGRGILRGIFGEQGTFLVRHSRSRPLAIWAGEERLGIADSGSVACFGSVKTGSFRARATVADDTTTVRATSVVLTPEDPLLWDVDQNQTLPGRVHAQLCEDRS